MQPDINQHLKSMCKALEEIVLPELEDNPFAFEQAGLIAASMKLLIDVQEEQFSYLRQEFEDTYSLLQTWEGLKPSMDKKIKNVLSVDDLDKDLCFKDLKEKVPQLKIILKELMNTETLETGCILDKKLNNYIQRQLDRETSWLRLTGFIPDAKSVPNISEVLEEQMNNPL